MKEKDFWESVESASQEVDKWPDWMKNQDNDVFQDDFIEDEEERNEK